MSGGAATDVIQPESFAFSSENMERAEAFIARYPEGRQESAVMPLLDLSPRPPRPETHERSANALIRDRSHLAPFLP